MTNLLSRALPPPTNWQDFERLCFDVFSRLWQTNDAQLHGRTGQPQAGVDVYGHDRVEKVFAGVQCKGKDQSYENSLTAAELRGEVEKAKSFHPIPDVFILATSAPNDEAIQEVARELTEAHKKIGLFEVRVEGWTTFKQRLSNYPDVVAKYYPDLAPVGVVAKIDAVATIVRDEGAQTRAVLEQSQTALLAVMEKGDPGDRLQVRITDTAKLVEDGMPAAGLKALERLWNSESAAASPRNRYRMRANIGFARLILGDRTAAIADLRAAAAEDPAWPNARAVLATAEALDGNRDAALAIAKEALAADSGAHQATTVIIEAMPDTVSIADLEARIPAAHLQRLDVLLTFAQRARDLGDKDARARFLARASELFPQDWRVYAALAEPLLEPIFATEGMALTHVVPATMVTDLERAIALLQQAWDQLTTRDNARVGAYVAANLLAALDIAGRKAEYEQLLAKALNIAPTFQPLLRRYARSMSAADDWAAATKALESIPIDAIETPDRLLKIQAMIHLGQARGGIEQAKALELELGAGRDAEIAAALQIEAAQAAGCMDEVLPDVLARWPQSIIVRSIAHNFLPEDDPRRQTLIEEIKALAAAINDPGERMHAADALYAAGQFSAAADMYAGLYTSEKDTIGLFRALRSLFFAERRREARELFDRLSPALKVLPRYAELGVAVYEHAGLLRESRTLLEASFAQDETLRRRLHWLALSERMGDTAAALAWLKTVPHDQAGTPQDLMHLALAIDRFEQDPRCFGFAYRALRAGYTDPHLHFAYVVQLVFMGNAAKRIPFTQPTLVGRDTAVLLGAKNGSRTLTRILESESDRRLELNEIAPDSELGPVLLGKKVGDEIEVPSISVEPTVFVVREIRDKYLHAHFRSLEQFESLFPGFQAFGSFYIDESKGEDKFKPIFDSVKRRGEFAKQLTDMYRQGQVPLMLLSKYSGVSPCDTWEWIGAQPDLGFRVCVGLPQEFANVRTHLTTNRRAVVDPITLYGLSRLGIAEKVRACFDDLGVVQTTIDLLRRLVFERKQELGKQHGSLGWDGEHYRMVELSDDYTAAKIKEAETALTFAECLTLVAAEPNAAIPDNTRELFEDIDHAFLDTIYAAQGDNRLFLCDDGILRQLASELGGVAGVWTQLAALSAGERNAITADDYYAIANALVSVDYRFTMVDNRCVLYQLRADGWTVTHGVRSLAVMLALPTNEPNSVIRLLADLAQFAWPEKPARAAYIDVFAAIFAAFRRLQPERDLDVMVNIVLGMVHGRLRRNGYRVFLKKQLLNNVPSISAKALMAGITQAADAAFEPLADAVVAALDKARHSDGARA